jgi:heme-degrading monooxygenase HmoA
MYARISRFGGLPPERITETVARFEETQLPQIEQMEGFKGALVGVDRGEGKAVAITLWDSEKDLRASDKLADEARDAAVASALPEREPIVDRYEVLLQR